MQDRSEDARSVQWSELLIKAVQEPGTVRDAYSRFWNYSTGNQILAYVQMVMRGITPGPIASFNRWKELGRFVKKGEKAIALVMPITCKRKKADRPAPTIEGHPENNGECFTLFALRNNWFALSQTDGAEYTPEPPPAWDEAQAFAALNITRVEFDMLNGNIGGFAYERSVAVSPLAPLPFRVTIHEVAHVVLGHTTEASEFDDADDRTPRHIREVEAEAVALLVCASLGMPGIEHSRGYIQRWIGEGKEIPEASARKVMKAADLILKAGIGQAEAAHA